MNYEIIQLSNENKKPLDEEKVIKFIKSKSSLIKKELSIKEAEKIITNFNESKKSKISVQDKKQESKSKKSKKISKK